MLPVSQMDTSSFGIGHLLFLNWTLAVSQIIDAASELDLQERGAADLD